MPEPELTVEDLAKAKLNLAKGHMSLDFAMQQAKLERATKDMEADLQNLGTELEQYNNSFQQSSDILSPHLAPGAAPPAKPFNADELRFHTKSPAPTRRSLAAIPSEYDRGNYFVSESESQSESDYSTSDDESTSYSDDDEYSRSDDDDSDSEDDYSVDDSYSESTSSEEEAPTPPPPPPASPRRKAKKEKEPEERKHKEKHSSADKKKTTEEK